jgi:hypothetical protein
MYNPFPFLAMWNTGTFNNGDTVFPRPALWDPTPSRSAQALLASVSSQYTLLEPQPAVDRTWLPVFDYVKELLETNYSEEIH